MLDNILKAIDEKAKQEIDKLLKQKKEAIFALESEHQKALQEKQEREKSELVSKVKAEIEEFRQRKQQEASFRLQAERNKMVEAVYRLAEEKTAGLSDGDFKAVVKRLLEHLPEGVEGEISAGKRTAAVLGKMFSLPCLVRHDLPEEGLVFRSRDMEIDLRISQVLKQNREKTDPEVIKILFSQ